MDEIAALTPTFAGVSFKKLDELGSIQWPCNDAAPDGTRTMHVDQFVRGKGHFVPTAYVATDERANRKFPLLLTTGRILSQYNVGAQTRRTPNNTWHPEDVLDIHPSDAEMRGIHDGDWVSLASRVGETTLKANLSERMPRSSASCGWISMRSSLCQVTFAVRRVCAPTLYCDRTRPVVISSG